MTAWHHIRLASHRIEVTGPYRDAEGKVHAMSASEQRAWAESIGGRLPTAEEFDAIWAQADVRIVAKLRAVMSAPLDAMNEDVINSQSDPGDLIHIGKTWVDDGSGKPANYGLFVRMGLVSGGKFRGMKVYPTTVDAYVIQPAGHAHGPHHKDWSQAGYAVRDVIAEDYPGDPFLPNYVVLPPASGPPVGAPPYITSLGDRGREVVAMQQWLMAHAYRLPRYGADGDHGAETQRALAAYLADRAEPISGPPDTLPGLPAYRDLVDEFIQARHFTKADRHLDDLQCIVLHSTENPIRSGTAHNVAMWFGGPSAPQASAHFVVGPEAIIQCVALDDVAWAAPGANRHGIQIEMVGEAAKTQWSAEAGDRGGRRVMVRAADLVSALCRETGIPIVRVDADGLRAGERGITTHASVTEAFKRSTHVDPGMPGDRRWPWSAFLTLVRAG